MSKQSLALWHVASCRPRKLGLSLLLLLCLLAPSFAHADSAQYFYDPAGRLTGVLDPVNGSAQYSYDKSGNISAIVRSSLSTITVLEASPVAAHVGDSITIAGSAFGTTANTSVSFNGTSATPSAVTSTSLTVTVPSGATTGTLSVTAPSGTATWSSPFSILDAVAPVITSFSTGTGTPTVASPGDSLTISGTDFDTTRSKVFINGQFALITSASSTSLVVVVPPSSSGKVQVATPAGIATSSSDLAVTPPTFAPADVYAITRTTIGASPVTISAGSPGNVSLGLLDATAGDRVSIHLVTSGLTSCASILLLNTNGTAISTYSPECGSDYWAGPFIAPQTGTYSIALSTTSGSGSFTLAAFSVPPDATAALTTSGSAVNLSLTAPGQRAIYTFSGTVGDKVSIRLDFSGLAPNCDAYYIMNPDTTDLVRSAISCTGFYGNSPYTLPQTGTYTIVVTPRLGDATNNGTGTVSATYYSVPADPTAALTSGTAANLTLTAPGQRAVYTFSGTAGDRVSLLLNVSAATPNCSDTFNVKNPDGSNLQSNTFLCGASFTTGVPYVLSQTGTYTITVWPNLGGGASDGTGTITATYFLVPADPTTALTSGTPASQSLTVPGQHAVYTFSGTTGDRVTLLLNVSGASPNCSDSFVVKNPDGSTLQSYSFLCGASFTTGVPYVLSQTGTYTVTVWPNLGATATDGTGTIIATYFLVPADPTTALTSGTPASQSLTVPGQHAVYTFSGTAGDRASVFIDPSGASPSCFDSFIVKNPDGSTLQSSSFLCGSSFTAGTAYTLSQTGTYSVTVWPDLGGSATDGTGSISVTYYLAPADATASLTVGGGSGSLTFTTPGQQGKFTFSGTASTSVTVDLDATGMASCGVFSVLNPDTSTLFGTTGLCTTYSTGALSLSQTGTYTISVMPNLPGTGTTVGSVH